VARENLWIYYRVGDDYLELLTVRDEPPIPDDE
jgi:hypothetical protein